MHALVPQQCQVEFSIGAAATSIKLPPDAHAMLKLSAACRKPCVGPTLRSGLQAAIKFWLHTKDSSSSNLSSAAQHPPSACRFRRLYNAAKTDRALSYALFFLIFAGKP